MSALVLVFSFTAVGLFYYLFSIPEPEGLSLASWPQRFTDNFSYWMRQTDGKVSVTETGLTRLKEYGLWLQVLDEAGQEVYAYGKPEHIPTRYALSEVLSAEQRAAESGQAVFISSYEEDGKTWNYLVGFPYAVGKYMLYYNADHQGKLSFVAGSVVLFALGALVLLALGYGFWLSRQLGIITSGIRNVSLRAYRPLREKGTFREIYTALNQMAEEIKSSDRLKEDTDRTRAEWIANITHDLKTPLSPVKGYAELLADNEASALTQEYGSIILKNANLMENLINDLKLTYQLDAGTLPYHPQEVVLTRCLKELLIDIVNDPAFSDRDIGLESNAPALTAWLDPHLLRRALQNLVINALTHNPPETKVTLTVSSPLDGFVHICVCDNGVGLKEEEQSRLFDRYFRATGTGTRPEGSGLGLAIAKQIVTLHGGTLTVSGNPKEGTKLTVMLPTKLRPA